MKFLIDQQPPRRLCAFIQSRSHEAAHVKDIGMAAVGDRDIWREARRLEAVIVTKDEDFSQIIPAPDGPKIVWVCTGNCSNQVLLSRFERLWPKLVDELNAGVLLVELR